MTGRDVEERLAELERRLEEPRRRRWARPRRRAAIAAAGLLLAGLIPASTIASHIFGDVPTNSTFHTNIANIQRAGITVGCTATKYCPSEPVRRDQMAAFLNRGLGRAALGDAAGVPFAGGFVTAAQVELSTPGAGFVLVNVQGMAYTFSGTCPCVVRLALLGDGSGGGSYYVDRTFQANTFGHIGNTWLFPIAEGGSHTFVARISRTSGNGTFAADTVITALWVPFDGSGQGQGAG